MKVSASIVPDSCRLFLWCAVESRGVRFWGGNNFLFAIQGILQKMVCRCTEPRQNGSFPSATQGISQKRVCRCIVLLFSCIQLSRYRLFLLKRCVAARNLGRMAVSRPRHRGFRRKGCVVALCFCFSCIQQSRYRFFLLKWCVAARNLGRMAVSRPRHMEFCGKGCVAARNRRKNAVPRPRYMEFCGKGCIAASCFCFSCIRLSRYRFFFLKWCVAAWNRRKNAVSRPRHREFRRKGCVAAWNLGMEPRHGASARSLCTNPLRRTAARTGRKVTFYFCGRRGRVRNCF